VGDLLGGGKKTRQSHKACQKGFQRVLRKSLIGKRSSGRKLWEKKIGFVRIPQGKKAIVAKPESADVNKAEGRERS